MFMHGGYLHLFSNLLFLWIFGDHVEHRSGSLTFLCFYLVSRLVATVVQVALDSDGVVPSGSFRGDLRSSGGLYSPVSYKSGKGHRVLLRSISTGRRRYRVVDPRAIY